MVEDVRTVALTRMLGDGVEKAAALGHSLKPWRYYGGIGVFATCSLCGLDATIDLYPTPHLSERCVAYWGVCLPKEYAR